MIKSCYYTLIEKGVGLIFSTSTPLTVGLPALLSKWFKGTPFVFEVRDLWPEVPIQMGALNNPILKKSAIAFEKIIYKNAKNIIALSPGMKEGVLKRLKNKNKVTMIPNMSKIEEFYPRAVLDEEKRKLGLNPLKFNCIHFGAIGKANGLDSILKSAKYAHQNNIESIEFIFLGEGGEEISLKNYTKKHKLKNVVFLGPKKLKEVSEIVNACDLSIVSFAEIEILKTNSPNKLFDSLSAGKPIIVNSSGWTKDIVENSQCGFYVNPNKAKDLIDKIQLLQSDKKLYKIFTENSRKLAETKYDKSLLVPQVIDVIKNTVIEHV